MGELYYLFIYKTNKFCSPRWQTPSRKRSSLNSCHCSEKSRGTFMWTHKFWKTLQLKFWLLSRIRKFASTWGNRGAIFSENHNLMNLESLWFPSLRLSSTPNISSTLNPDWLVPFKKTEVIDLDFIIFHTCMCAHILKIIIYIFN